jgi:speckle-type POZ protein
VAIVTMDFKSLEFTWKITNFSQKKLMNRPGKWISSQTFYVGCEGDMKFILKFYPQGDAQPGDTEVANGEKWTSLFLLTQRSKKYDTSHRVEFSILDANGETFRSIHFHRKITFKDWGLGKFTRLTDLENPANNLLPNDTLTICCRVKETTSESEECNCQKEQPLTTQTRRKLLQDFAALLDDKFADFVFKVENVNIPAHRAILAARSPVFAAMFQHDMMENKTNETEIEDVTPATFKALLQFIYTGHCKVGNLAEELLVAANKYDIQDLRDICAKELRKKLTVENAVDFLLFSDLHQANDLKDGAIRFIIRNAKTVKKPPYWSDLPRTHPNLILELTSKAIEYMKYLKKL